jgi:hypothetical protein
LWAGKPGARGTIEAHNGKTAQLDQYDVLGMILLVRHHIGWARIFCART